MGDVCLIIGVRGLDGTELRARPDVANNVDANRGGVKDTFCLALNGLLDGAKLIISRKSTASSSERGVSENGGSRGEIGGSSGKMASSFGKIGADRLVRDIHQQERLVKI